MEWRFLTIDRECLSAYARLVIQYQLKLWLSKAQKRKQLEWLPVLGSIFNFGVRKIELNARNKVYFLGHDFQNLLAGHSERLGIPSHTIQGVLPTVHTSWQRCFKGLARRPRPTMLGSSAPNSATWFESMPMRSATRALYPLAQRIMRAGEYMPNRMSMNCSRRNCSFWRDCEHEWGGEVRAT